MNSEPRLKLLYLLANPELSSQAQVAVTMDPDRPTLNTLEIYIQNPDAAPVVEFDNADQLTPEDPLPGAQQVYTGPRLDRLYVYFPWGAQSGQLAPSQMAAAFTLSPAPDNSTWWVSPMSSPDLGPYWLLFPKTEAILLANESVRFVLSGVQTPNPPNSTTTFIVEKRVIGYRDQTDRDTQLLLVDAPPKITSLTADPSHVPAGSASKLSWTTWNAESVTVRPGEGLPLPPNGNLDVFPTRSTTYVLEAFGPTTDHSQREPVTVTVDPAEIESFTANPTETIAGYPVELAWQTRSATAASISPDVGPVPVNGTKKSPPRTVETTYTLRVDGENGPAEKQLVVGLVDALHFSSEYNQGSEGLDIVFQLAVSNGSAGALVSLSLDPPLPDGVNGIYDVPIPAGNNNFLTGFENFVPAGYVGQLRYSYKPQGTVTSPDLELQARGLIVISATQAASDSEVASNSVDAAAGKSWNDLYLRAHLDDEGLVPRKAPWNRSPDLISSGILPVNHPSQVFDSSYDQELAKSLVAHTPNYIYLRVKNLSAEPRSGKLYLYYAPSQLLLYPQIWSQNALLTSAGDVGTDLEEVGAGDVATGAPFVFLPEPTDQSLVLIGRLVTEEHPNPVPDTIPGDDFDAWIADHGDWARFDAAVTPDGAADLTTQILFDMGRVSGRMEFLLTTRGLPAGSEIWASSGTLLPDGTNIIIPPSTIPGPGKYVFGTVAEVPAYFATQFQLCYRGGPWEPGGQLEMRVFLSPADGGEGRLLQKWTLPREAFEQ